MNDGTAFPFVWLAIAFGLAAAGKDVSFSDWLIRDVAYKIIMGVVFGILLGRFLAYLLFTLPKKGMFKMVNEGFVALSATLLVYGLTQLADAYGFIAVFVAAVTVRNYEMSHEYHKIMHAFMDQVERIMVAIGLLIFGGGLLNGLLSSLTVPLAILGVIIIFLIRPLSGQLALIGTDLHANEKWAISFFGIKGMGSFYYLAFALEQTTFRYQYQIWSLVSFIVLLSIVVHGMSSNTVMRKISKRFSFR
jgi:NhaP-type Na+/H+ or K+/H+ antiporter